MLRSINYSPAQTSALNMLIKRVHWNARSGSSSPCSFARNAMFSSLFAVLELSGRCATSLSWSNSDHCSEGSELDFQSISLACVKLSCLLYLLRHLCGCQGWRLLLYLRRCISVELPGAVCDGFVSMPPLISLITCRAELHCLITCRVELHCFAWSFV